MNKKELIAKAWNIYEDFIFNVPYSSISQLFLYLEDNQIPLKFGIPCALQANELATRFKENGFKYCAHVDNRHANLVVDIEDEKYLFDPYLLHSEPVNLSEIDGKGFVSFNAYPIRKSKNGKKIPGIFKVRYDSAESRLVSIYNIYDPNLEKHTLSRKFRFDTTYKTYGLPPKEVVIPLLFHPEQTTISMRILCKSDSKLYNLIYPICWYHGSGKHSETSIRLMLNDGRVIGYNDTKFKFYLQKIADNVGCTKEDLIDLIMEGVNVYEKHSPENIEFHKYQLEIS